MTLLMLTIIIFVSAILFILSGMALFFSERPIGMLIAWLGGLQMSAAIALTLFQVALFLIDYIKA